MLNRLKRRIWGNRESKIAFCSVLATPIVCFLGYLFLDLFVWQGSIFSSNGFIGQSGLMIEVSALFVFLGSLAFLLSVSLITDRWLFKASTIPLVLAFTYPSLWLAAICGGSPGELCSSGSGIVLLLITAFVLAAVIMLIGIVGGPVVWSIRKLKHSVG